MMEGIRERLDAIVRAERAGLADKLDQALSSDEEQWQEAMREVARRKLNHIDWLPDEPGAAVDAVAGYEFVDEYARDQFDELILELRQHVLEPLLERIED